MRTPAFWDTSALVPLCLRQDATPRAQEHRETYSVVAWWSTQVEIRSAIAREFRAARITGAARDWALARLQVLKGHWSEILPGDDVRKTAVALLDRHDLQAADSLQLAAAMVWSEGRFAERTFLCADTRLSAAAEREGFSVLSTSLQDI